MFRSILLDCIASISMERSTASIFHLLVGKRSIQTLQDAKLYKITRYFGICKHLDRNYFEQEIKSLIIDNYITVDQQNNASITRSGETYLNIRIDSYPIHQLNGFIFDRISDLFWLRLQLWIQTYTNMARQKGYFVAITDQKDIQAWVKKHFQMHRDESDQWLAGVYRELSRFLKTINPELAQLFVDRLTGYQKIGLTLDQLARKNQTTPIDMHLYLTITLHKLLTYLQERENELIYLPVFYQFTKTSKKFITNSAEKTFILVKKGFDVEQISQIRQLKINTIEDHIVEIAYIDPDFSIKPYVDQESFTIILAAIRNNKTVKLKQIKEMAGNNFSYFQIRLVLTYADLVQKEDLLK
ncbi:helix-turn-helix domain-containing protein [Paraliobacillus zengyii]|uniref:helix-turn-helix domain-containing protein n=1 Tax=Paraliobacillus zengyii TaxID=2213194 RepID=UPI000DD3D751|nr:helix-turn-helix domain-containing protein [Paraliobacillus zengyii]